MAQPVVIDLFPAELGADGIRVYRPALQALGVHLARGLFWLLTEYPREVLHGLALGSVAGICLYLACDAGRPKSSRRSPRLSFAP